MYGRIPYFNNDWSSWAIHSFFLRRLLYYIAVWLGASPSVPLTVASVTTDGFITDIENLEYKILNNPLCQKTNTLIKYFKELRGKLSGKSKALELKNETEGLVSWATRGQLGLTSEIRATTGFQNRDYTQSQLVEILGSKLKSFNH